MKRIYFIALLVLFINCSSNIEEEIPDYNANAKELKTLNELIVVSHMAGKMWGNFQGDMLIPEESSISMELAYRAGFRYVEIDVRVTQDGRFVCMHDTSINRTMQNSDGTPISNTIKIKDENLSELKSKYKFRSFLAAYETQILTLEEFLQLCAKYDMIPFFHSGDLDMKNIDGFINIVEKYSFKRFFFMSENLNLLKYVRNINSECLLLLQNNKSVDLEFIRRSLYSIKRPCGFSSSLLDKITPEFCQKMKKNGYYIQASIAYNEGRAMEMINNGVSLLLTGGCLNYNKPQGTLISKCNTDSGFNTMSHSGVLTTNGLVLNDGDYINIPVKSVFMGSADLKINMKGKIKMLIPYFYSGILETSDFKILHLNRISHDNHNIRLESVGQTIIKNIDFKFYNL